MKDAQILSKENKPKFKFQINDNDETSWLIQLMSMFYLVSKQTPLLIKLWQFA